MVILWLIYGYYMGNIWLLYGKYMVNNDYSQYDGKVIIQPCSKPPTR
jgi:hypothetical protein